jgi:hypothetical protein
MPPKRSRRTVQSKPASSPVDDNMDNTSTPQQTTKRTTRKRNVSEALGDSEGQAPTKSSQQPGPPDGVQKRQRRRSASPVSPPKGPRKRTNERPGLIGKRARRTTAEVKSAKAAKEAEKRAAVEDHKDAMNRLAQMEIDQEQEKLAKDKRVVRRLHSFLDVMARNGPKELISGSLEDVGEVAEKENNGDQSSESDQESEFEEESDSDSEGDLEAKLTNQKVSVRRILLQTTETYCHRLANLQSGNYALKRIN